MTNPAGTRTVDECIAFLNNMPIGSIVRPWDGEIEVVRYDSDTNLFVVIAKFNGSNPDLDKENL